MTGCPYPIYADPTGKIYKALGMKHSTNAGNRAGGYEYTSDGVVTAVLKSGRRFAQRLFGGRADALKGGVMTQIGGEFVFDFGANGGPEVEWCHKMADIRDHATVDTLRKALSGALKTGEVKA
jgi:hypothetical protein